MFFWSKNNANKNEANRGNCYDRLDPSLEGSTFNAAGGRQADTRVLT